MGLSLCELLLVYCYFQLIDRYSGNVPPLIMDLLSTSRQGEILGQNISRGIFISIPAVSRSVMWCLVDEILLHNPPHPTMLCFPPFVIPSTTSIVYIKSCWSKLLYNRPLQQCRRSPISAPNIVFCLMYCVFGLYLYIY